MKKWIGLVVVLAMGILGYVFGKPLYELHFANIDSNEDQLIYIPSESKLSDVASLIDSLKILSKDQFILFSDKLEFTDEKVEAGKYLVKGGMKTKELIYALKNGNQEIKDTRVTFNNCRDIYQLAGKVAPSIEADSTEIVTYIMNPETINHYGFTEATICSMFLPDTYEVGEWDMNAEEFVQFMAEEYKAFWGDEGLGRGSKLAHLNLKQSEVSTLASIIEAEQGIVQKEWPTIAGLYLNRVRKRMRLESDPTAKFCWGDELEGVQRLLDIHMKRDCPYNTYLYAGLPPGPIRIPSKKAIDAVLNAEDHDYLFMCASPDNSGLHNFAVTYSDHLKNAKLWWQFAKERGY